MKEISVMQTSQITKGSIRKTVNNLGLWKIEEKESWSSMSQIYFVILMCQKSVTTVLLFF